jgi:DNA-binding HxlR family transcriptional regulator
MTRTSLENFNCSFARTADLIGDKWTLLIIRDAFYGTHSFSDFKASLGAAPTVLTSRLQQLCDKGILEKVQGRPGVDRFDYHLTERGKALFPVVLSIMQWGDTWIFGEGKEPIRIVERETGAPLLPVSVQAQDGHPVEPRNVAFAPGPGASAATVKALEKMKRRAGGVAVQPSRSRPSV